MRCKNIKNKCNMLTLSHHILEVELAEELHGDNFNRYHVSGSDIFAAA